MLRTVIASRHRLRAAAIPMTRRAITIVCGAFALVALGTAAMAFWSAGGGGTAAASSGTLNAPTNVFASSPGGAQVAVSWEAATLGNGQSVNGYYVTRITNSDGTTSAACGTSATSPTSSLSCDDLAVGDGAYHYTVTALQGSWSAQSAASPTVTVASDTTPPSAPSAPALAAASDSGNSSSDAITNDTTPTFTGTAEAGSTVTLYDGVSSVGSAVASGGSYTITASTRPAGTRSFTARATDAASNTSPDSSATLVVIDTTAPATQTAPVLDASSDSGVSNSDRVTNDTTPMFTGAAEASSSVSLYDGVTLIGTATATGGGTYIVTSGVLPQGTKSVTTRATDVAGNASTSSPAVSVTIDTVGPTGTLNQAVGQADPSSALSINFTATFSETVHGFAGTDITYSGTAGATTATVTGAGPYNVAVSGMTQSGTVIPALTASKVTDAAGNANTAATSTDATVTYVDTTAPSAPSTPVVNASSDSGSSNNDAITNDTTPTFTGTAEVGSVVRIYRAGTTLIATSVAVPSTGVYTATATALTNGAHAITARATDAASNQGIASGPLALTIDTVAPTVTVARASGQGTNTTTSPINFTVTFSEGIYGFVGSDVAVTGTASTGASSTITGTGPYNVAVSGMRTDGTVIAALPANAVQDVAGNNSAAVTGGAAGRTVTYNDITAPTVVITSLVDSGVGMATISGTAGFTPGDGSTVTVVVCGDSSLSCSGGQVKATLTATVNPTTGAWSITGSTGAVATAYAKATQTDGGGNTGTSNNFGPVPIT